MLRFLFRLLPLLPLAGGFLESSSLKRIFFQRRYAAEVAERDSVTGEELLLRLLQKNPEDPVLLYDIGVLKLDRGEYKVAADYLRGALASLGKIRGEEGVDLPDRAAVEYNLAVALHSQAVPVAERLLASRKNGEKSRVDENEREDALRKVKEAIELYKAAAGKTSSQKALFANLSKAESVMAILEGREIQNDKKQNNEQKNNQNQDKNGPKNDDENNKNENSGNNGQERDGNSSQEKQDKKGNNKTDDDKRDDGENEQNEGGKEKQNKEQRRGEEKKDKEQGNGNDSDQNEQQKDGKNREEKMDENERQDGGGQEERGGGMDKEDGKGAGGRDANRDEKLEQLMAAVSEADNTGGKLDAEKVFGERRWGGGGGRTW